jgi:broad specificity phosphatase PhoE
MQQLWLVRHGHTSATESGAFGADEPLIDDAFAAAGRLASRLPTDAQILCSPALRCRQTATAAGLSPRVDPGLDQVDLGRWRGRTFAEVHFSEPEPMSQWLSDPAAAPHGGDSLAAFATRVAQWLDRLRSEQDRTVLAVTHSEVIRAAVLHALAAPLRAFWQLTIAPLSITELHRYDGTWTVERVNSCASC